MKRILLFAMAFALVAGSAAAQLSKPGDEAPTSGYTNLTGGPDGFGYTFADTAEANCSFQFVDIAGTGTAVPGATADDGVGTVALSEAFMFYGASFMSVVMDSNGLLSFNPAHASDLGNSCPLPDGTDPRIDAVHDDLDLANNPGQTAFQQYFAACPRPNDLGGAAEGCTVFQWDEAEHFATSPPFDIQAILYHTTGEVVVQWDDRNGEAGSGSTTGIQSGADSLTYACDTAASLPDNAGVCFFAPVFGDSDLVLVKTGVNNFDGTGVYTLTVTNNGPDDEPNAIVTDTLPAGVAYVSDDCGGSFAAPTFTWNIGALANGASVACNVTVNIIDPADTTNMADVSGFNMDPDTGNNSSSSLLPEQSFYEIPTLGQFGLLALVLALAGGAIFVLRRR